MLRHISSDLMVWKKVSTLALFLGLTRNVALIIPYIWTREGWLVFRVVIDLYGPLAGPPAIDCSHDLFARQKRRLKRTTDSKPVFLPEPRGPAPTTMAKPLSCSSRTRGGLP